MNTVPRSAFATLCGHPIVSAQSLKGGRNSRVWLLHGDNQQWIGKEYFSHPKDHRDRLGTEFGALRFLRAHGVDQVPSALACDRERGMALYSFLPGRTPASGDTAHALAMGAFAKRLWELRTAVTADDGIGFASEACLCAGEIGRQVRGRLKRLRACDPESPLAGELLEFVDHHLTPALDFWEARAGERFAVAGRDFWLPLPRELWTLSPSDFGLHNTLYVPGEPLRFLDFEYFGWDDPAKLLSDVLLHRGVPLSRDQKLAVSREFRTIFGESTDFSTRVKAYVPLLGLKWCCILCNEFVRGDMQRRTFATAAVNLHQTRATQLAKARQMLDKDILTAIEVVEATLP